jgi:GTP-binding protein
MFEKPQFIKSAFNLSEIPKHRLPEVILCGRSNVGKSSFINSFFNRKDLAKVSSTPGKTRSINFYEIDSKFYVVDLPGYGYAKTSKTERAHWSKLIGEFITKSNFIRLAIHFIDSRHKPTDLDHHLNNLLQDLDIPYLILLSKVDKLKQSETNLARRNLEEFFTGIDLNSNVVLYSSVKHRGRKEIAKLFEEIFQLGN